MSSPRPAGHGRSAHAGPDGGYQLLDFLSDLDSLTATLGTQPFVLVGHSMGAVLGAILSSLRPERVQRLMLIEPVVPAPGPSFEPATQLMAHLDALTNSPQPTVMASVAAATPAVASPKALSVAAYGRGHGSASNSGGGRGGDLVQRSSTANPHDLESERWSTRSPRLRTNFARNSAAHYGNIWPETASSTALKIWRFCKKIYPRPIRYP
jgi:pimeloyl-ACP methyl ester carboxylesterase